MRKYVAVVAGLLALSQVSCRSLHSRLDQYPPEYMHALGVAEKVLGRHFVITGVDKAHGIVGASSLVQANIHTKYRTRAEARVFPVGQRRYDIEVRVTNELEVSQPSLLGRGQPPHDWRAVGLDHVLEAALMTEVQAELQGRTVTAVPTSTYLMFPKPSAPPLRHRDLLRPRIPDPAGSKPQPQPQSKAPAPKPPAPARPAPPPKPAHAQLYEQYMTLGDGYARRRENEKALLEYQRAAMARPSQPAAHLSLASVLTALGRYEAAAGSLRAGAAAANHRTLPSSDVRRLRAIAQDVGQRLLLLKGWCKKHPNDGAARLLLGYHCLLAERADEARATLSDILKTNPGDDAAAYLIRQVDARQS